LSERRARGAAILGLLLLAAIRASAQDAYPSDITPPAGTQYPCALTALPRGLPGIPEADREYVNRTYARILRATQAKLVLLKALEERQDLDVRLGRYLSALEPLVQRQRDDGVPAGLEPFQQDVLSALALQQAFFSKAAPLRAAGGGMDAAYRIGEGRQASSRLIAAWSRMQARYPGWPTATRDSVFHHLCALDLF
jgi:hypothetical protein